MTLKNTAYTMKANTANSTNITWTTILLERFIMLENCAILAIRINKAGREQRIFQIRDSRSALIIVRIRSISMRNGFARTRFMISVRASAKGGYIK